LYKKAGLHLRRKTKKRIPARVQLPLEQPATINQTWSIDFMSDSLENGRTFRTFNVIDDCSREALHIAINYSIKSSSVVSVLNHLIKNRSTPLKIRMDNGPEFIAHILSNWGKANNITLQYIQPGKPMQNGYIERFNRTYREKILDGYSFETIDEVRIETTKFMIDYNEKRPHESLGGLTPLMWKCGQRPNPSSQRSVDHSSTSNTNNNNNNKN
jgi:putative transposase